jgi:hypothetical protein
MSYLLEGTSSPPASQTVSGSPYTYQNTTGQAVMVIVQGGTVLTIQYSIDGATWLTVGLLAGMFFVRPGDYLRANYVLAPTVTVIP